MASTILAKDLLQGATTFFRLNTMPTAVETAGFVSIAGGPLKI